MIALKFVTPLLQFSAQLAVIVNLSVKDDDELCVVRHYRLMPSRQIDHGKAPAGQMHRRNRGHPRSEEHTSELQSHSNISYAVFCLKKKKNKKQKTNLIITKRKILKRISTKQS